MSIKTTHSAICKIALLFAAISILAGCASKGDDEKNATPFFAKGADVGWVTEMEAAGVKFRDSDGNEKECIAILKSKGINSIRLRAWVNPAKGWNNTVDLLVKAKRAKAAGMKLIVDFHYSDTWADPGHQPKPAAWTKLNVADLEKAVNAYTIGVMDTLKQNGITPEWVQVGNETNDGMLWEEGRASKSMENFAALIKAGYTGVKSISGETKVIVHLSNGYDNAMFRWMFDGLRANGAKWDIIGMSLYPTWGPGGASNWAAINQLCLTNMSDMIMRYGTPVMLVEVGMPADDPVTSKAFLSDIINKTRTLESHQGLGVFYWEPECYNKWNGYDLGAFDSSGKPTVAMDAFLE